MMAETRATRVEKAGLPIEYFPSAEAFADWLAGHHRSSQGIWLKIAKKASGTPTVSYSDAVDVALCYGWIDGQKDSCDGDWWLQRFTPRKPRSKWSKVNCGRAEALIASGAMQAPGLCEIERAKADGRWAAAYESQRTAAVPEDLQAALDADPAAAAFFTSLDSRNRYAVLYRIGDAKKPETRRRRIEQYVAMCSEGKKIYP
jgi:uncharacterized protein YdeI (YjbR/CyaY-like superfamily)